MPNSWKKNAKYFDTSLGHSTYTIQKNNFRKWKKQNNLKDNLAPFGAELIGEKTYAPPKDYLKYNNSYSIYSSKPLSYEDESNWSKYLKSWKCKMSNQTYRHKGCKPNCGICNPKIHGKFLHGERKHLNKSPKSDFKIKIPVKKTYSNERHYCTICFESKPEHIMVQLACTKGQKNKNYICNKCRNNVYKSEYDTCPLCRKHAI